MAKQNDSKEYLQFKVMRISCPSLNKNFNHFNNISHLSSTASALSSHTFTHTHSLILPSEQEDVLVGEEFKAYLSLMNISNIEVERIIIQVDIMHDNKSLTLFNNIANPLQKISPNEAFEFSFVYFVAHSGDHIINCTISHIVKPSNDRINRRKMFRFTSLIPFEINYQIHKENGNKLILCIIKNISNENLLLINANIKSSFGFLLKRHSLSIQNSHKIFDGIHLFRPKDCYSLVFMGFSEDTHNIGELKIEWNSYKFGPGVQTKLIQDDENIIKPPILLNIKSFPNPINFGEPFCVQIQIKNQTNLQKKITLEFDWDELEPLLYQGTKQKDLGVLEQGNTLNFPLWLLCMQQGFHSIKGLTVKDTATNEIYWKEKLGELFVL